MRKLFRYILSLFLICLCYIITTGHITNDENILDRKIKIEKNEGTIYQLLRQLSEEVDYLFIYDSQIIDNDKKVKIAKGTYTLHEAIQQITDNKKIALRVIGKHILLYIPDITPTRHKNQERENPAIEESFLSVSGLLTDRISNGPIPHATISIGNSSIGTISNQSGEFKLIVPDSLKDNFIRISHLGFQTQEIEISLLADQHVTFTLNPEIIPLQEIVIRKVNPHQVLKEMIERREENYSNNPINIIAFYREGSLYKNKNTRLSEAVLKLYKTGVTEGIRYDQAKLLKMRTVNKRQEKDTVIVKMKSGIHTILQLDIMKNLPDFLMAESQIFYNYNHTDITVIDGRRINVISFEPKEFVADPLFKGGLYIDAENCALVQAIFEINPPYIKKATDQFINKRAKGISISPEKISYKVTYKASDGKYYINHIRGDLHFRVRKKRRLFSSSQHIWFEMVNCEIDSIHVTRFPRTDKLPAHNIFSETKFVYDPDFWGNFNTILPEEKLKELITQYFSDQSQ